MPTGPTGRPARVVIGVGNPHRRDDRCGLDVLRTLAGRVPPDVALFEAPADATALLDLWADRELAIVVDAVRSDRPAGTLHRWALGEGALPTELGGTSTHGLGIAEAVGLGRSLDRLPRRLTVLGIEAADLGVGEGLTPSVARAVVGAAHAVLRELASRPGREA